MPVGANKGGHQSFLPVNKVQMFVNCLFLLDPVIDENNNHPEGICYKFRPVIYHRAKFI